MTEKEKKEKKPSKLQFKTEISSFYVIGIYLATVFMMWGKGMIEFNFDDPGLQVIVFMGIWILADCLGIKKPELAEVFTNILKIINDTSYTMEQKVAIIGDSVKQFLGIWADLSQILNTKK